MTVKELRAALKAWPKDAIVYRQDRRFGPVEIDGIRPMQKDAYSGARFDDTTPDIGAPVVD